MIAPCSEPLTAYFDESYNHPNPKKPNDPLLYTVSCLLSTVDEWKKFGIRWSAALKKADIEFFHMKDFESRYGDYTNWSDYKRITVLKRLHRIAEDHRRYGCAMTVDCNAHDSFIKPLPQLQTGFGKNYYGFNVRHCMIAVNQWCARNKYPGPITYIFADLAKQGGVLDPMFRSLNADSDLKRQYRLNGTWTKGIMKDVVQLQAADIFAYEFNKRAVNEFSDEDNFTRKSLAHLNPYENFDPIYFGAREILGLVNDHFPVNLDIDHFLETGEASELKREEKN